MKLNPGGKFRNFTVLQHILLQYAAIQKPQKGRDKRIHFLKALFKTNSEIDISRPYLWGYLLYSAPKITTSQQMRHKEYSLNPPLAKGNGCNRPPPPPPTTGFTAFLKPGKSFYAKQNF